MPLGKGLGSLIPQQKNRLFQKESAPSDGKNRVWHIPISEIVPNSEQPRREFSHEELEGLASSIKQHGVLQPLTVTERENGGYELIAGERRLRAATVAGFATVPCLVRAATRQEKLELALVENIQRQNLNPIEEAFAYKRLIEEFDLTQEEAAKRVGRSRPVIANTIRLLDLPEPIQRALSDGKISVGKARALLSLKSADEQMRVFVGMLGEKVATVREAERIIGHLPSSSRKGSVRRDPNLRAQEELLEERLGAPVTITQRGERGTIVISYFSKEELKRLLTELT